MNLQTTLLEHQQPAVHKMLPTRVGALFMDMGTGKTRVAIELAARRQARIDRVLIFCPVSLKETWRHEIAKHTDADPSDIYLFDNHTSQRFLPAAFWCVAGIESMSASNRYSPIYDRMWRAGLYKRNMRISQSFCDVSKQGIPIIREIEPESYERFLRRVAGVNSLTHIDLSDVLDKATQKGVDYNFLMQLYPEKVRDDIQRRIDRSQTLDPNDPRVVRALLNNDIRLKRVNRSRPTDLKAKYADL